MAKQPGHDLTGKRFKDEQTDKRVHEHLLNEKDSISEADIKNVKTDESITQAGNSGLATLTSEIEKEVEELTGQTIEEEKEIEREQEDKLVKGDSDPGIETTWNILES